MFVFIVVIVCEGNIEIIVYILDVFDRKVLVIIIKGLGKVVDLVFGFDKNMYDLVIKYF